MNGQEEIDAFLAYGDDLVLRLNGDVSDIELHNIRSHLHLLDLRIAHIENGRKLKQAHGDR